MDYLPQEVLIEILTRLPIKSLLLSRCVSKSWNSLINSPLFINTHLMKSNLLIQTNPLLLIKHRSRRAEIDGYTLHFNDESCGKYLKLRLSDKWQNKLFHVVGSCNGVICLLNDGVCFTEDILFWNPSIRKELKLPAPSLYCYKRSPYMAVVGFGFDVRNDDYKVVRIVDIRKIRKLPGGGGWDERNNKRLIKAEVYSLNAASWKSVDVSVGSFSMPAGQWNQAFLNGVVYWVVHRMANDRSHNFVLSFNLSNEVFEEILLPECVSADLIERMFISVYENSVTVVHLSVHQWDVWLMKEHGVVKSWTKHFNFKPAYNCFRPMAFWKDGKVIMENYSCLYSCDSQRDHATRELMIYGKERCYFAGSHVESLVLLDKSSNKKLDENPSKKRKERSESSARVCNFNSYETIH